MNVTVLTTTYPRYPADPTGSFIVGQARDLARQGHIVHVIAPHDPSAGSRHDESDGSLHVHRFHYWLPHRWESLCYGAGIPENFRRNRLVIFQLPTLIASFATRALPFARQADIIHGHWSFAGIGALIAARLARKKLVITMHGAEALAPQLRAVNRFLIRQSSALVVNSAFTRDTLRGYIPGIDPAIVPFGYNQEKLAPAGFDRAAFREAQGIDAETTAILAVGRLVERKGFHVLLDAAARLPKDRRWRVIIGGKGPERDALLARAESLGLADQVTMLGFVPDDELARWHAAADIFALPAIVDSSGDTEGLGVVLLEAMANGTPVVASRIGGITDIVRHEETGLLAAPAAAADLAAQIARLMSDNALRARLTQTARQFVADNFSWRSINQKLLAVYQRAVQI